MQATEQEAKARAPHRGPHPGAVGIVHAGLFIASLIVTAIMTGGGHFPSPCDAPEAAQRYLLEHAGATRIGALLQFGAAIPLGIFTAAVVSRLQHLGMNVAGVMLGFFGGLAASVFIIISALAQWTLSQPGVAADIGTMRAVQLLAFGAGGPGCVVPLGILLAGATVPSAMGRLLPRWLIWLGLGAAAICELSTFSLILPEAAYLLPVGRLGAMVWIVAAGFMLPRSRAEARERRAELRGA